MKPGLLLLLLLGAIGALFSAWWLLGSDAVSGTGGGTGEGEATEMVTTLAPDATLVDVEARPRADGDLAGVDANDFGARTAGAKPRSTRLATQQPKLEAATGPYTGRLVDSLGRPMKGVEIFVESWEDAAREQSAGIQFNVGAKRKRPKGVTADDGKFEVTSKEALGRSIGLTATVRGFSESPVKCVLDPEKGREMGDVALKPAVIVSGWVRDAGGSPIVDARIRRVDRNGDGAADLMDQIGFGGLVKAVRTDADGWFELPHEDEGLITLKIESDEILTERWDGPTKRAGDVLQDVVIVVKRAGQIQGTVVGYPIGRKRGLVAAVPLDAEDDDESSGGLSELVAAQLSPAGDYTCSIEPDGSFTLPGLVPGARYRLRAIAKKFFVETVELSEAVDATAGLNGSGETVSLQFDPGVTITFQVLNKRTKEPVELMEIAGKSGSEPAFLQLAENAGDPPDRFPDGKVTLYELRPEDGPERLSLSIDGEGYFRNGDVVIDVPVSGTVNIGKIFLEPAPLLKFRVVDAVTRKPVKRARVTVDPLAAPVEASSEAGGALGASESESDEEAEQREAAEEMFFGAYRVRSRGRTDRKGYCPLSLVAGSGVSLEVKARGYATHVEAPFEIPADTEEEVVIELFGGGTLQVRVTDTEGAPAVLARVQCRRDAGNRMVNKGANTDDNGFVEFEHIAAGAWEVRAFRADNSPFAEGGAGSAKHPAEWSKVNVPRRGQATIDLGVPAFGDLSGIVLLGNRPSADARVALSTVDGVERAEMMLEFQGQFAGLGDSGSTDTTDFEGRFTLTDIVPGDYVILTVHPDLAMVVKTEVTVEVGDNSATVDIPATSLEGRVLDDSGAPVVGAAVSVERRSSDEEAGERSMVRQFLGSDSGATARTDVNGAYTLMGVESEVDLVVLVVADGYADASSESLKVATGETRMVPPIAVERAGAIVVTSGKALDDATTGFVRAEPTGGRALETLAPSKVAILKAGRARIGGLVPGTWKVTLQEAGESEGVTSLDPKTIEVESGETAELEF